MKNPESRGGAAMMRGGVLVLVSVLVAALALLALDDITTGREPDHFLEWTMVAVAAVWFMGLGWWRLRRG